MSLSQAVCGKGIQLCRLMCYLCSRQHLSAPVYQAPETSQREEDQPRDNQGCCKNRWKRNQAGQLNAHAQVSPFSGKPKQNQLSKRSLFDLMSTVDPSFYLNSQASRNTIPHSLCLFLCHLFIHFSTHCDLATHPSNPKVPWQDPQGPSCG